MINTEPESSKKTDYTHCSNQRFIIFVIFAQVQLFYDEKTAKMIIGSHFGMKMIVAERMTLVLIQITLCTINWSFLMQF